MVYVGSAESEQYDQELESVLVGPVEMGVNRFIFQADPPDLTRIPVDDVIGVTVVLLTCSYKDREFIRIGYYVQNEWTNPAWNPPDGYPPEEVTNAIAQGTPIDVSLVQRNILADKPRVTRFHIAWDDAPTQGQPQPQAGQPMEQAMPQGLAHRDPNLQTDLAQTLAGKGGMVTAAAATPYAMEMD